MCVCWSRFVIAPETRDRQEDRGKILAGQSSRPPRPPGAASDGTTGVYGITVAAELTGMSVQALRLYERKGLVEPTRTTGGTRRYSDTDIIRLRRIGVLIDDGINLTGIARVLGLEDDNAGLRSRNADLRTSNAALRASNAVPVEPDEGGPPINTGDSNEETWRRREQGFKVSGTHRHAGRRPPL